MRATRYLKENKWRHNLKGRKRDFRLFSIPKKHVIACDIKTKTKREVIITLSGERKLQGYMTITSGTELSFPAKFKKDMQSADWFECEIIGRKTSDKVTIDWR